MGGTIEYTDCKGFTGDKKLGIGIRSNIGQQIANAWAYDSSMYSFGKIIKDGDFVGWFERPMYMRSMVYSIHKRIFLSGYTGARDPITKELIKRAPPEWPDGYYENKYFNCDEEVGGDCDPPVFYISNAQNITWEVIVRLEKEIID